LTRCLCSLALVGNAVGARRSKRHSAPKFIANVPVLNYPSVSAANAEHEWVVMAKEYVTDTQIKEMCLSPLNGCDFVGSPSQGGVPFFKMRGTEGQLEAVLRTAGGQLKIEYVELDQTYYAIPELSADNSASLWGLDRVGASQRTSTGRGVTVYVMDTGIRHSHQDFGGRARSGAESLGSLRECNGAANCAGDAQGHGTHCAGSIGGTSYGVAPGASISSVKVLSDQGSGSMAGIVAGIDWVATRSGPRVGSMSLGGPGVSQSFQTAIDSATRAGVTITVAGGNDNSDSCNFSPAFVASAITVGSTDVSDRRSSFSNYGRCTNIWAPGSYILSAGHRSDSGTATMSGTSMACPHVAGGAALLLENNPGLSSSGVLSALSANSKKNQISDLKSGDTNEFLWVGGAPSPTPPSPTPPSPTPPSPTPPSPTPPTGSCVHETDCNVSPWCTSPGYAEWCRTQGEAGSCPAPFCKQI
jgi:subtilisin family serine protease